ncbi:DUF72 domain-containing protein [Actinorugispora endophytica]|uniref:Uncharacterized protein YecE (DUF72 family) n=1 Tax=Actinorugispora endophytica TaxID=1605990 RepID=A0A4R6V4S0_9ACTN|nr:DUF72 domain-containing protein [Actinorugispora endophytica]TDQ53726.1 uncharacterized protein YecE (DUF72 family) [Actinorugispora endophytica]
MGDIRTGTASWTDPSLVESGWYPADAATPAHRLAHYASRFPIVEVDSTYYSPPAERTAHLWAERTPDGFTFNIKAFSLFTHHPTRVSALPVDLRAAAGRAVNRKGNLYLRDTAPELVEQMWERFLAALRPLERAGRLGAILLQFPQWFPVGEANRRYLLACRDRCAPMRVCVEFRNRTWMSEENRDETLGFLRGNDLPYVCVDMPQGHSSSVPPVAEATSDLAVVRFHGRSEHWASGDKQRRFGYRYSDEELAEWVPRLGRLAEDADTVHVLFNNCLRDHAPRNAERFAELLRADGQPVVPAPEPRAAERADLEI